MRLNPSGRLEALGLLYVPAPQIPLSPAQRLLWNDCRRMRSRALDLPEVPRGPKAAGGSEPSASLRATA